MVSGPKSMYSILAVEAGDTAGHVAEAAYNIVASQNDPNDIGFGTEYGDGINYTFGDLSEAFHVYGLSGLRARSLGTSTARKHFN